MDAIRECAQITFGLRMGVQEGRPYPDAKTFAARQVARTQQLWKTLEEQMEGMRVGLDAAERSTTPVNQELDDYLLFGDEDSETDSEWESGNDDDP